MTSNATRRQQRAELLTTADAALAAGVSEQTIYSWHRRGLLTRQGTKRCALWDMRDLGEVLSRESTPRRRVARSLPEVLDRTASLRASQPGV